MDIEENKLPIIDKAGLSEIWRLAKAKFLARTELDPLTTAIAMVNQKADANTQALTPINQAITELGYQKLSISGGTMIGTLTTSALAPSTNNTYDIGTSSIKYRKIYATTFYGALSGNSSTATTLKTTRTLWGQDFNGSANVGGNMTGVGSISMNGAISGATTGAFSQGVTMATSSGGVGIGGSADPYAMLKVNGNTIIDNGFILLGYGNGYALKDSNGSGNEILNFDSSDNLVLGGNYFLFNDSKNVEIQYGANVHLNSQDVTCAVGIDNYGNATIKGNITVGTSSSAKNIVCYGGVAAYGIADLSLI